jgi:uncharacterized HAD superfamily protein
MSGDREAGPVPSSTFRQRTPFEDFLLTEYQNIVQAHFNTINAISAFIGHYIVIVSLPISAAVIFLRPTEFKNSGIAEFLKQYPSIPLVFFTLAAAVGWAVLGYVINLRHDAVLYARTVNGIRKYFFNSSDLPSEEELRFRVLPKRTAFPRYTEWPFFGFVVLAFAILGTGYFLVGYFCFWQLNNWPIGAQFYLWAGAPPFFLHILLYITLGFFREKQYLGSYVIGIDIDGVLNDHRRHFADILKCQTKKEIHPDSISRIPVRDIPGGTVTEGDEHAVFNWPDYWTNMPPVDGAANFVQQLRDEVGYQIWVFTQRDWPQPTKFPTGCEDKYWDAWRKHSRWIRLVRWRFMRRSQKRMAAEDFVGSIVGRRLIHKITKEWLQRHGFKYDGLVIERGKTQAWIPRIATRNRFIAATKKNIRVFVEDNLQNAKKLADACSIVFLIDHPYNKADSRQLAKNIIRVKTWGEIYEFLRSVP